MIRHLILACAIGLGRPMPAYGQGADGTFAKALAGCWAIDVGSFTGTSIDSGMTTLPHTVRLDTLPGVNFLGQPMGWRVEAVPSTSTTEHRVGSFARAGSDSAALSWSGGFTGLEILVANGATEMKGEATLWTDYGGTQRAPITLRRIRCP